MVMVEVGYQQNLDGMPDGLVGGVALSIPFAWRDRQRNEVAMARSMVRAADVEASSMRIMAEADLRMAWSRARAAERTVEALERTALPRLRETIASIESAYVSGRGEFLALLDAIMQLQELELRRVAAISARGVVRFELDRIAGVEVTR
jgi:outer membrane protein TolC